MAESNITKNALADAMKQLMAEKKFEKISVTDICDRCGMNRKSFYYHFRDKYDLVNWIFYVGFIDHIHLSDYEPDDTGTTKGNAYTLILELLEYFYQERGFYKKALKITGQNSFRDYFHDAIVPVVQYFLADVLEGDEYGDQFLMMICDAFIDALVRWLCSDEPEKPKELLHAFQTMLVKFSKKILQQAEELETGRWDI